MKLRLGLAPPRTIGDRGPGADEVPFDHRLRFDAITKHLLGGMKNRFPDGQVKTVTSKQNGLEVAYLRCGMFHPQRIQSRSCTCVPGSVAKGRRQGEGNRS